MGGQIRVLHFVPSLNRGSGVTRFVYNMTMACNEERVHYDFLHHGMRDGVHIHPNRYDEELEERGHVVYKVSSAGIDLKRFMGEVREFFAQHGDEYDIVHCHVPNGAFCVLREAHNAGLKHRVMHSHLNSSSDKLLHRVRNAPLIAIGKRFVTDRVACSQEAGEYLYGRKPFTIVNNGIPLSDYAYDAAADAELRGELNIPADAPVIGCVGRFAKQKNFEFAVRAFASLRRLIPNSALVIVGTGDGADSVRATVVQEGLGGSVFMPGMRLDVARFYSLFDVFFMPSLYEGLPVSAVEAQASGLRCVFSTGVPAESDIVGGGTFLSLDAPLDDWACGLRFAIEAGRISDPGKKLAEAGYSAEANAEKLMGFYEGICREDAR